MSLSALPRSVRVAVYARYSSENQRDASIEDQLRICHARASREGWEVIGNFTDHALSGATAMRPGYQALLAAMRTGQFDLVLSESLDRLSRDQEHVAGLHKQASFARVRIVTLAEGEISELHVGLKGTMGALYLKDLADKTRRGLEGRIHQGRSGGGLSYGYRVVRGPIGRDGEFERGLREIDEAQAKIVQRIFAEFAGGTGPKTIAAALNREQVPGPRGGIWQAGTLRGQAMRETGLLRNRLYIGELVWNQRRWLKDPGTGRRVARANDVTEVVREQVPELRIVDQALWDRVQLRLRNQRAVIERDEASGAPRRKFWEQRRPTHILSGLVHCGHCRTALQAVGRDYLACRVALADGPCDNRRRVRRGDLEGRILDALGGELMRPDLVALFVGEFTTEWNRLASERTGDLSAKRRELAGVERKLSGLVDAIADGLRTTGLRERLVELENKQAALQAEITAGEGMPSAPVFLPNIPEVYRARVADLRASMEGAASSEVREALRALIARVEVFIDRTELTGHLTAMLRAGGVEGPLPMALNAESPSLVGDGLSGSAKWDAGTGFEPVTFRL